MYKEGISSCNHCITGGNGFGSKCHIIDSRRGIFIGQRIDLDTVLMFHLCEEFITKGNIDDIYF